MKTIFLLISCLCTVVSGTLRHFDHAAADAVVITPVVAPAPAAHPSFAVRVVGQGPQVLLLAGLGCSGHVWDAAVARYARSYQCHVVSLAGFAGTAPIAGPLLPTARRELLAYVRSEHLRRPVVVGHSLGGFLALLLATDAPAEFGQVVVLDALPFGLAVAQPAFTGTQVRQVLPTPEAMGQQFAALSAPQFAQLQRQLLAPAITDTTRLIQLLAERLASDPATLGRATAELLQTDLRPLLPHLALPYAVLLSVALLLLSWLHLHVTGWADWWKVALWMGVFVGVALLGRFVGLRKYEREFGSIVRKLEHWAAAWAEEATPTASSH